MEWKAQADFGVYGPALRIARFDGSSIDEVVELTFERRSERAITDSPPPISGLDTVGFMQAIMDAGYAYGLRPSKGDDVGVKEHLKDMREITRHLLKMNK